MKTKSFNDFINEDRGAGIYQGRLSSAPVKALAKASKTIAYKILKFIWESGKDGVRYTDILKFIIEDLRGDQYDSAAHRGYYATNLVGTQHNLFGRGDQNNKGLLGWYCDKSPETGRWSVKPEIDTFFSNTEFKDLQISDKGKDLISRIRKSL